MKSIYTTYYCTMKSGKTSRHESLSAGEAIQAALMANRMDTVTACRSGASDDDIKEFKKQNRGGHCTSQHQFRRAETRPNPLGICRAEACAQG